MRLMLAVYWTACCLSPLVGSGALPLDPLAPVLSPVLRPEFAVKDMDNMYRDLIAAHIVPAILSTSATMRPHVRLAAVMRRGPC
jgi:hypothetical protein